MADNNADIVVRTASDLDDLLKKAQKKNKGFTLGGFGENFKKSLSSITGEFNNLDKFLGTRLQKTLGGVFDAFLNKGGDAKDLLAQIETDLLQLGDQFFKSNPNSTLIGGAISSIGSDYLGGLFPGFATGGSFTVGGAAGHDRNLVGVRLSRGERVDVATPAQQRKRDASANPSSVINLNYNIQATDVNSFRRSQTQIQTEAFRNAQRLMKRNG